MPEAGSTGLLMKDGIGPLPPERDGVLPLMVPVDDMMMV